MTKFKTKKYFCKNDESWAYCGGCPDVFSECDCKSVCTCVGCLKGRNIEDGPAFDKFFNRHPELSSREILKYEL